MKKISKETAEHYTWGDRCDGWHLVKQPALSVILERMPPGTAEVHHYHRQVRQYFHMLVGTGTMELDGERIELRPGEGLEVPPGAPHHMRNLSGVPIEFLVSSQPHAHGDRETVGARG